MRVSPQRGAATIKETVPFGAMESRPWVLTYDGADEEGYLSHMWQHVWQPQVLSTSLHLVFIICVVALALVPLSVYDDAGMLLLFLCGQLVPTGVLLGWAFFQWSGQIRYVHREPCVLGGVRWRARPLAHRLREWHRRLQVLVPRRQRVHDRRGVLVPLHGASLRHLA